MENDIEENKQVKIIDLMNEKEQETYQYSIQLSQLCQAKKEKLDDLELKFKDPEKHQKKYFKSIILNETLPNVFDNHKK